ncbi:DUF268 domain-containing protein [Rhodoferax mekongensis]|uniref:DUF268 domain-containing protein n=1 Tax=Rhodoferax mekongensis TaxID=3068341 RepID=A0ABZ0AVP5_9BURK|nr:DUF268 domain-containing protein [Rhodoferax sp. TBRC 17307]WNO03727.1 DUF268 domain-containing protein [Rhodoferax sp. TBRC 17307]
MSLKYKIRFFRELQAFKAAGGKVDKLFPIYSDYREQAGSATGHYFHQDLLVAGYIATNKPDRHIDVGSRIDGFVAHVAAFRPIEIIDVRELADTGHGNIRFKRMDLMKSEAVEAEICDSLSCLHAIEHFGLGRYGDPVNPSGHLTGFRNLLKMLKPMGTLYISFPIGDEDQVQFNAHRIFKPDSILNWQSEFRLELLSFSFVDDAGSLHKEVPINAVPAGTQYGCGIYTFRKH